jgi:hypothetical protein
VWDKSELGDIYAVRQNFKKRIAFTLSYAPERGKSGQSGAFSSTYVINRRVQYGTAIHWLEYDNDGTIESLWGGLVRIELRF